MPRSLDWLPRLAPISFVLSLGFFGYVVVAGFDTDPTLQNGPTNPVFRTYFEAYNWALYPAYFLFLFGILHATWGGFAPAWKGLVQNEMISGPGDLARSDVLARVQMKLDRYRRRIVVGSVLLTALVSYLDLKPDIFAITQLGDDTLRLKYACTERDAWVKWIYETAPSSTGLAGCLADLSGLPADAPRPVEKLVSADFTTDGVFVAPGTDLGFILFTSLQQTLLIFMCAMFILQFGLHTGLFWVFERVFREDKLTLRLTWGSGLNAYGLEDWNLALNQFYKYLLPPLAAAWLALQSSIHGEMKFGQLIMPYVVVVTTIAPIAATIASREQRVHRLRKRVARDYDPAEHSEVFEALHKQRMWPVDSEWVSKFWILAAVLFSITAFGVNLSTIKLSSFI